MLKRTVVKGLGIAAATMLLGGTALAQEAFKIGLIVPMTGPSASTGRQIDAAVKLYMAQNGDTVAGKKIQVILKDDTGAADQTKRLAQDLIVNDKVNVLAGFGLTPLALAVAPLATQAKIPEIVMAAGTSIITEKSSYIVRSSFTTAQKAVPIAEWAAKNGMKKIVTMVTDYGPGIDAEASFKKAFTAAGGEVTAEIRTPLRNPEFAPFLQKIRDLKPDAMFLFTPSGLGAALMKQVAEREFDKAGIKVIATGDVTDDDQLNEMGDSVLGMVTTSQYSTAHPSPENKAFVAAFKKANPSLRPNFMAVGGYDGMHLIYEALKKTGGKTDGDSLVEAMKGMKWLSVRGPVSIDPETRDIIQNIYVAKVEKVDGELYNIEFATVPDVKDPVKAGK